MQNHHSSWWLGHNVNYSGEEYALSLIHVTHPLQGGPFYQQLQSVHYQSPPWSVHYPQLVHIFQDHPCVPVYNTVEDNQYCHGEFIDVTAEETREWLDTVANNTIHCWLHPTHSIPLCISLPSPPTASIFAILYGKIFLYPTTCTYIYTFYVPCTDALWPNAFFPLLYCMYNALYCIEFCVCASVFMQNCQACSYT